MKDRRFILPIVVAIIAAFSFSAPAADQTKDDLAEIKISFQYEPVAPKSENHLKISFSLAKDWHFYAPGKNTPEDMLLKITASGQGFLFSAPIMPAGVSYSDKVTNTKLNVYSGDFIVYVPFITDSNSQSSQVKVTIDGVACSGQLCKKASYELTKNLEISASAPKYSQPGSIIIVDPNPVLDTTASYALPLAVLAGLLLNIMPCVWPILPIIVMRLVSQAEKNKAKSIMHGVSFAIGIILFFAVLAAINIILKLGFGLVFQWGDQFRNPALVTGMALLMVVLSLYMFGLFTVGIPASVSSGKQNSGFFGSVGTGFLAAVLSTPCSFAILTFVLVWAQTQPIPLATITILLIGVGMGAPYVILTMIPRLLQKIPKPGRWMELFKHATGFILLGIGVKLLEAAQADKIINILYYAVVLAVCVWMWGVCVTYDTPAAKKWLLRLIAIVLAVLFGLIFLGQPQKAIINWQPYDANTIASAQKNNQPVLMDFTADWCLSCKILDKTVYSSKKIADLIKRKNILAIKADTTGYNYPAAKALREIYNEPAVPVNILLLPGKDSPIKLRGNLIKNELIKNLQTLEDVKK